MGLFRTRGGAHPAYGPGLFRTKGGAHLAYGVSSGLGGEAHSAYGVSTRLGVVPILHMGSLQD